MKKFCSKYLGLSLILVGIIITVIQCCITHTIDIIKTYGIYIILFGSLIAELFDKHENKHNS